jgi:Ribosomal protein L7/L12 C-terminal domain
MEYGILFLVCTLVLLALTSYWDTTARIGRIERKLNALLRHHGVDPTQGLPLSDQVKEIAGDPSRKIEAIKVYREETGAGLKEAKDAVEAFINSK